MNKLDEIIARKHVENERLLPRLSDLRLAAVARNEVRSFQDALSPPGGQPGLALIAEIKRASPSAGTIASGIDPVTVAQTYQAAGASAISVLTDHDFFGGSLEDLVAARGAVSIPVLRKDFIVHEVQIYEAVIVGADAILLIVAALDQDTLVRLLDIAHTFQLDVLVEVHNMPELERALNTDAIIIGINNRNLKTFEVDLSATEELSEEVGPEIVLVSESGIRSPEDARFVQQCGATAILVGETLMRSDDVALTATELIGL